jgi:hypothetical protein
LYKKKLSGEEKNKYPDGLKNFLDDLNTKTTELEEIVSQKFKNPVTFQRFKDILIDTVYTQFWTRKTRACHEFPKYYKQIYRVLGGYMTANNDSNFRKIFFDVSRPLQSTIL